MESKSTFGEINKEYWEYVNVHCPPNAAENCSYANTRIVSTKADTVFNEEWVQNLMRQIVENLQSHFDWIGIKQTTATESTESTTGQGAPVRMLDYACGSGMASRVHKHFSRPDDNRKKMGLIIMIQALFPYVSVVRGIDVSDAMVEQYNKSARTHGVPESQMFAIQGDLAAPLNEKSHPSLSSSDFLQFDLIVMSMALHHIDVPKVLIQRLVERLSQGGVLVIIDWTLDQEDHLTQQPSEGTKSLRGNTKHAASHTVSHEGFSKEQMGTMLRSAGCNEVDYLVLAEPSKLPAEYGGQKQLFFARGKK